jgi:hypothetical protein
MAKKIQIRRGQSTTRAGLTPSLGEPYYDKTTSRLFLGDGATAGAIAVGGQQYLDAPTLGTTTANVTPTFPTGYSAYLGVYSPGNGSGAYTLSVLIPVSAVRVKGDTARFSVTMPANANPTLNFYSQVGSNPLLTTVAPDSGKARTYVLEFYFDGSNWQLLDNRQLV